MHAHVYNCGGVTLSARGAFTGNVFHPNFGSTQNRKALLARRHPPARENTADISLTHSLLQITRVRADANL